MKNKSQRLITYCYEVSMIIQAYNDGEVSIFGGRKQIYDLICMEDVPHLLNYFQGFIDEINKECNGEDVSWGSEAKVRFS